LRNELHPRGVEVATVSLELSGPEASRPFIEAAGPEHPSLIDASHQMDAVFGVVNVPNVVWIDEQGTIVRPAEPGWPEPRAAALPSNLQDQMPAIGRAKTAPPSPEHRVSQRNIIATGQSRETYCLALRDWVAKGATSEFALTPAQVVERSQRCSPDVSMAAAHFELAVHLWMAGQRSVAISHFNECHRLQPGNWTYKRQAWSLLGNERVGGDFGRFAQGPVVGEEDDWPFASDFRSDLEQLGEGEYYPKTM
jgi:hypothetical protein